MFNEIEQKEKVYSKVLQQFQDLISTQNLKPGDKLPPEREMAKLLGVSRPALKQALSILESQHIIECKQGDGNYILPIGKYVFNPIVMSFYVNQGKMEDILEFRYLLEIPIIKIVTIKRPTKDDLSMLYEIVEQMRDYQPLNERIELNTKFHYELVKLGGNALVTAAYSSILDLIGEQISSTLGEHFKRDHLSIIEAILSGNPNTAASTMLKHFTAKFPNCKYYNELQP